MKAADQATGRLPGDTCDRDWIWDREVETKTTRGRWREARPPGSSSGGT